MKGLSFGCIALIVVCYATACTHRSSTDNADLASMDVADEEYGDSFYIETLSDKNIYFIPDTILPNDSVVNDMVDMANGFAIMRAAYCDAELWFRFGMVVNNEIGKIKTEVIKDSVARNAAEKYVRTLVDILPRDSAMWTLSDSVLFNRVWEEYTAYGNTLVNRFAITRYGKLTKQAMKDYMNIRRYIANYDSVYALRKSYSAESDSLLRQMAERVQDFDTKCLYTIEYAHQGFHNDTQHAIELLERLMMSGWYSHFLPDVWRTWRVLKQLDYGASRDSMIPNLEYNRMRCKCMNSILRQIVQHPKDMQLVANFCFLASYNNITRYGGGGFGNSVLMEEWLIFPELIER